MQNKQDVLHLCRDRKVMKDRAIFMEKKKEDRLPAGSRKNTQ